jgi:hypothetical protein
VEDDSNVSARRRCAELASQALKGTSSAIVAAREIVSLRSRLGVSPDDADVETMVMIDSETDALPVGPERRNWAAQALDQKAPEIARSEGWAHETGKAAFEGIVRRWGGAA